jgi:hypothetical protein
MRRNRTNVERTPFGSRFKKELKRVSITSAGSTPIITKFSTTLAQYELNALVVGADSFQRVGKKINMHKLKLRGCFVPNGTNPINDFCRLMLVYDRQSNSVPVFGSYVEGNDNLGNSSITVYDDYNVDYEDRFIVLKDLKIGFPQVTGASSYASTSLTDYGSRTTLDWDINLRNLETLYPQGGSSPTTGALWLVMMGENSAATAPVSLKWNATLYYTD